MISYNLIWKICKSFMKEGQIQKLINGLRWNKPWNYKAPFLISVPYFVILACSIGFETSLFSILASAITIIGIAGIGYYINDIKDIDKDRKAGKFNLIAGLSNTYKVVIFIFLLLLAVMPWFYLPLTLQNLPFFLFEFLLFYAYASPPLRLKEKGIWGMITDSLYAHANPALLAAITFSLLAGNDCPHFFLYVTSLVFWQFILGVRNILMHQIEDHQKDIISGTLTFVTQYGKEKSDKLLKRVFLPLELISFIFFALVVNKVIPFFIMSYLIFLVIITFRIKVFWKESIPGSLKKRLSFFVDDFYLEWIPLLILVGLISYDSSFIWLFIIHIFLFKNVVKSILRDLLNYAGII